MTEAEATELLAATLRTLQADGWFLSVQDERGRMEGTRSMLLSEQTIRLQSSATPQVTLVKAGLRQIVALASAAKPGE